MKKMALDGWRKLEISFPHNVKVKTHGFLEFGFCYDGGSYHIETSPLICSSNQWTCFYIIGTTKRHQKTLFMS